MFRIARKPILKALNLEEAFLARTAVARERIAYALRAGLPLSKDLQAQHAEVSRLVDTFTRAGRRPGAPAVAEAQLNQLAEALDQGSADLVYRVLRNQALGAFRKARQITDAALPYQPRTTSAPSRLARWFQALDEKALDLISPVRPGGPLRKQVIRDVKHLSATNAPGPLGVSLKWSRKNVINASSHGDNTYTISEKTAKQFSRDTVGCVMGHELAHDRHLDLVGDDMARQAMAAIAPDSPLLKADVAAARKKVMTKLSVVAEAQADADGVRFAARAGHDPRAFGDFFAHVEARNLPDSHYAAVGYPTPRQRRQGVERIIAAEDLVRVATEARGRRPA
ncbi:MAG: M48 family metalloprotease [Candidatus Sericytochromatia bacterium]|nr:M48 family metalloprotease [Candidatus Sericytochromatia bacterium]